MEYSHIYLQEVSHPGLGDALVVLEALVVMHLQGEPLVMLLALEHAEQALVDADVLLLRLNHPHPLLPHLVHDAVHVNNIVFPDTLQCQSKCYRK